MAVECLIADAGPNNQLDNPPQQLTDKKKDLTVKLSPIF